MITVMSNKFLVKPDKENTFIWFISDVCNLEYHELSNYKDKKVYIFTGVSEEYLTSVGVDKTEIEELGITDYEEVEEGIAVVDFTAFLVELVESNVIYYEMDTDIDRVFRTEVIITENRSEVYCKEIE